EDPGLSGGIRVLRGEREDGSRIEGLTRPQDGGREVGVVGRVREVLGLEGVRLALPVGVAADADPVTVAEGAGVELHARRVCPVGIRLASVGVKALALIWTSCFRALPEASPARLK